MSLVSDGTKIKLKKIRFYKGFAMFITNKDITGRYIKSDENKINF